MAQNTPGSNPSTNPGKQAGKPNDSPTKVKEPDNTRSPDRPTPRDPQRPMTGEGGEEEPQEEKRSGKPDGM